jgi:hypothetical protein
MVTSVPIHYPLKLGPHCTRYILPLMRLPDRPIRFADALKNPVPNQTPTFNLFCGPTIENGKVMGLLRHGMSINAGNWISSDRELGFLVYEEPTMRSLAVPFCFSQFWHRDSVQYDKHVTGSRRVFVRFYEMEHYLGISAALLSTTERGSAENKLKYDTSRALNNAFSSVECVVTWTDAARLRVRTLATWLRFARALLDFYELSIIQSMPETDDEDDDDDDGEEAKPDEIVRALSPRTPHPMGSIKNIVRGLRHKVTFVDKFKKRDPTSSKRRRHRVRQVIYK